MFRKVSECMLWSIEALHPDFFIGWRQSALHHGLPESQLAKVGTMGTESGKSEAWSPPSGSRTQRSSCARGRFWGASGETSRQIPQYGEQVWECLEAFVQHSRVQAQKLSRQWPRWRHNWLNLVSNPPPEEPIGFSTVLRKNIYLPRLLATMKS